MGERRFRLVTAGWQHTRGLTTDDRAVCWGLNDQGQVGSGVTSTYELIPPDRSRCLPRFRRRHRPTTPRGLSFAHLEADTLHTCGGESDHGGPASPRGRSGSTTVPTGDLGGFHTCGVTAMDRAFCWRQSGVLLGPQRRRRTGRRHDERHGDLPFGPARVPYRAGGRDRRSSLPPSECGELPYLRQERERRGLLLGRQLTRATG